MLGILAASATALAWAISTRLYHRAAPAFSSLQLTLVKGVISLLLLAVVLLLMPVPLPAPQTLWWLLASGAIGIGLGDLCFFAAMRRLGPRRALQLDVVAAPLALLFGVAAGSPWPGLLAGAGMLLIVVAVTLVLSERRSEPLVAGAERAGTCYALAAAACQALGLVLSHLAMTAHEQSVVMTAVVRLAAGVAVAALLVLVRPRQRWTWPQPKLWPTLLLAVVLGTTLAMVLQQLAIAHAHPGVVQTLLATAPLWALLLARLSGERVAFGAIGASLLAIAGVALLVLNR
ncbi:MAG: EamA family transporter [Gammaproteobacteria bacterium]|nr:EamA family transporter [Gammaproteobacteria bacterium]